MPRPVAIEARHHLAQRLLVEDQQAAPPTGQVVEATPSGASTPPSAL